MPVPIITVAQMRTWEQATWAAGHTETAVIARVGEVVARRAMQLTRGGERVLILAGKGHNGDDARQAEPHLTGREVELIDVIDPQQALTPVLAALQKRPALIIDGLFGIGLNRSLDAHWYQLLLRVNEAQRPVLAVDNPSGLNAETGEIAGTALRATITLTLGAPKRGLLAPSALPIVGRLEVAAHIGLVPCPCQSDWQWTLPEDFAAFPPPRPVAGHKGTFGHLAIIAGSMGYHGAAVLAARGAQRARPGLITLLPQENVYGPIASQLQAVMVHPWESGTSLENFSAILIGPGLASPDVPLAIRNLLNRLWVYSERPIIVDASALDWLAPTAHVREKSVRVITPHPGEAARLLQCRAADVQADRPKAVRELSRQFGDCWVVLKGHQTLVGHAEGELFVNSSGNPDLAQGGSGDVLAGYLAGWLAQPDLETDATTVIRFAVWQHGASADDLAQERRNWVVDDLVERLGDGGKPKPEHSA